ncbi:hypothetical protein F4821DRAFT_252543 [Hypoxylon rubiginosum]|uniref:Uncharacterized protein n=1 Tax=Hypoxylon rubiginosum TaxID=110542 RepID=A0ACC0DMD8_9PEZI|nr:hypothetical protein F4821DRAFT_252543 [Hypoxylon rubiginosum]
MDPTRASRMATSGRIGNVLTGPFSSNSTRHPGLALAALAATGLVAAVQYERSSLKRNERLQKNSPENPNLYVSVDRSGGGI